MDPVFLAPGEGEAITRRDTRTLLVKAEHELVDVTESWYGPGERGADPHVHLQHADAFYVLEGTLTLELGTRLLEASTGSLVFIPPGTMHTFSNRGEVDVVALNLMAPAGDHHPIKPSG